MKDIYETLKKLKYYLLATVIIFLGLLYFRVDPTAEFARQMTQETVVLLAEGRLLRKAQNIVIEQDPSWFWLFFLLGILGTNCHSLSGFLRKHRREMTPKEPWAPLDSLSIMAGLGVILLLGAMCSAVWLLGRFQRDTLSKETETLEVYTSFLGVTTSTEIVPLSAVSCRIRNEESNSLRPWYVEFTSSHSTIDGKFISNFVQKSDAELLCKTLFPKENVRPEPETHIPHLQ